MNINYDIEKLSLAATDFYNSTGVNISILDKDFTPLTPEGIHNEYCKRIHCIKKGKENCVVSDRKLLEKAAETKKAQIQICHAGLTDVAVPVLYEDEIVGYIILGQMKQNPSFTLSPQYAQMEKYYRELPLYSEEKIRSIANVATMLAKHILLENMLLPQMNQNKEKIIAYINENIKEELSIQQICSDTNISKNVLYRLIRREFCCTVSEYINAKRIEKAMQLLTNTDLAVEKIALETGFSSASYFTRTFKKQIGITPIKYRKQIL